MSENKEEVVDKKVVDKKKKNKDIEIVTGDGKNLDISPVYDHIKIDKPEKDKKKKIVIPKTKK